jgi:hypothetical protein
MNYAGMVRFSNWAKSSGKIRRKKMAYRFRAMILIGIGMLGGILVAPQLSSYTSLAQGAQPGCQTFTETKHTVCGRFLDYWKTHGGLAQQGYPLSEEFVETSALNGRPYTVQYFERAVFELHPENRPPNDVLLSQLGTFLGNQKYTQGFPSRSGELPFYEDRYFQGAPNPQPSLAPPYAQFVQGYANTASVTIAVGKVELGAAAGNLYASMPVVITATQKDGTKQVFAGCYVMHRANSGISENPNDELWSIWSAKISAVPPNSSMDSLLAQTCTP